MSAHKRVSPNSLRTDLKSTSSSAANMRVGGCMEKTGIAPTHFMIDFGVWLLLATTITVLFLVFPPHREGFYCDDKTLNYPYKPDTIPSFALYTVALLLPLILISVSEFLSWRKQKKPIGFGNEVSTTLRGYGMCLFGYTIIQLFVDIFKYSSGKLRPHFFKVCQPDFTKINCSQGYITDYVCTSKEYNSRIMKDVSLSFPSGHAALAFYFAMYVVFYLENRLEISCSRLIRPFLQSCLILTASWVGITRITDNKHHPFDVAAGCIMGSSVAILIFTKVTLPCLRQQRVRRRQRFSSVSEPQTPTPLLQPQTPIRIKVPKNIYGP